MLSQPLSFSESWKFRVHIAQIVIIVLAIILSIARVTIKNPPATRANTIAITLGIKSLLVITYQLTTEHTRRFRKWASTKANAVLNSIEPVFWLAVFVVTGKGVSRVSGAAAALSALVLVLAGFLMLLSIWMAGCSIKIHRRAKMDARNYRSSDVAGPSASPMYAQQQTYAPKNQHAYPPPVMQERRQGA